MELPEIKSDMKLNRKHYQEFVNRYKNMTPEQKLIPGEMKNQVVLNVKMHKPSKLTPTRLKYVNS
jgi:hypothetical protein